MIAPSETPSQRNVRLIGEAAEIVTGWPLVRARLRAAHGEAPDFAHPAPTSHKAGPV